MYLERSTSTQYKINIFLFKNRNLHTYFLINKVRRPIEQSINRAVEFMQYQMSTVGLHRLDQTSICISAIN